MIYEVVKEQMDALGVPYQYGEFYEPPNTYAVGECIESPVISESCASGSFILGLWSKPFVGLTPLLDIRDTLRARFGNGVRIADERGAVVIEYSHAMQVPSDVDGVWRLEVNLNYTEWRVS